MFLLFAFVAQASAEELCEKVFNAAASALEEKASGVTEASLRKSLPPLDLAKAEPMSDNGLLLAAMHEIVGEIYSVKKLDKFLYAVFKSEQCH
ncbi:hypothetical protein HC761_01785 [bacterium]|nr:hypothetical protein [bacterium]